MTDPKILEKVKKLFALSGSSNEHEASLALRKAQELMAEHGLSEGHLKISEIDHTDIKSQFSVSKMKPFELGLMNLIGGAFGCRVLWKAAHSGYSDNWGRFTLVGSKAQIPVAEYTAEVLMRKMVKARGEFLASLPYGLSRQAKTMECDGFCMGWVRGVAKAVHRMAGDEMTEAAITEYLRLEFSVKPDDKKTDAQDRKLGVHGYEAGKAAGSKESLFRPMEGEAAKAGIGQTLKIGSN